MWRAGFQFKTKLETYISSSSSPTIFALYTPTTHLKKNQAKLMTLLCDHTSEGNPQKGCCQRLAFCQPELEVIINIEKKRFSKFLLFYILSYTFVSKTTSKNTPQKLIKKIFCDIGSNSEDGLTL